MNKIDFVLTWVDGSDLEWQKRRQEYSDVPINNAQYRDWNILMYWFRSIEKFAPWVNKIYVVTEGHLPEFLDTSHEKLVIVKHEDFIPKEYLPVFSSHPIELNLHRIEGLQEQFVYFNDDVFLNNVVQPKDFFYKGVARDIAVVNPITPGYYNSVSNIMANNIALINSHYSKRRVTKKNPFKWFNYRYGVFNLLNLMFLPWSKYPGLYQNHMASSMTKEMYKKTWELFPNEMDTTCSHRVRNNFEDINQWLIKEVQICEGEFFPQSKNFGSYFMVKTEDDAMTLCKTLEKSTRKVICVNDHVESSRFKAVGDIVKQGFELKFPEKSSFEK